MFESTVMVDQDGRFEFKGLPPGQYKIQPVASQNVPFVVEPTTTLEIKPGQRLEDFRLPLVPCREVRGMRRGEGHPEGH